MEKRSYTLAELEAMPVAELLGGLRTEKFSILKAAHSRKLRAEMKGCGLFCRAVLGSVSLFAGQDPERRAEIMRRRLAKLAKRLVSGVYYGRPSRNAQVLVFGFNHPSLGEILRFIYAHLAMLPERYSLFPVNLPWYEMLAPSAPILEQLGIMVLPILTPSTLKKIGKNVNKTEHDMLESLRQRFTNYYDLRVCELAKSERTAIWVAPSATRQATVFADLGELTGHTMIRPQTMTLIATMLTRIGHTDIMFVPVAAEPSRKCGRGLNLFRQYGIHFGKSMGWPEVEELRKQKMSQTSEPQTEAVSQQIGEQQTEPKPRQNRGRRLEHEFRVRIAQILLAQDREDLVVPYP